MFSQVRNHFPVGIHPAYRKIGYAMLLRFGGYGLEPVEIAERAVVGQAQMHDGIEPDTDPPGIACELRQRADERSP